MPVVAKLHLHGGLQQQVTGVVQAHGVGLVGVQLPHGRIPQHLLQLIRACPAPVLVCRQQAV